MLRAYSVVCARHGVPGGYFYFVFDNSLSGTNVAVISPDSSCRIRMLRTRSVRHGEQPRYRMESRDEVKIKLPDLAGCKMQPARSGSVICRK